MQSATSSPTPLASRPHLEILDGLRGVAAVAVVVFHFMEIIIPDSTKNFIGHGYLAVDFFFCLSGFVIAYAYDKRIEEMSFAKFFMLRLIRLHPLILIGTVIGLVEYFFDPFVSLYAIYGAGKTLLLSISSAFLIPYPLVKDRYANIYHLNPPTWSLLWEYIASIIYATLLFRLRNKALWVLTIFAAVVLFYTAYHFKNLAAGWSGETFWGGGARVFFSFLVGMLVYRSQWILSSRLGLGSVSLLLLLALLSPFSNQLNWITEPLIIIFYFPFLISLGAGAQLSDRLAAVCKFSGDISYPLYIIHYPFIWLFFSYMAAQKPSAGQLSILVPLATIALIVLAYLTLIWLDIPIRRYLKRRLKKA
ncbi:acyltransferase family protein [Hymenobacter defluvii]|uniref:Acyltransferase n=1 Tax=Hymenobacter defluvii TaxID=2054411 RepID=A0ABS3TDK1_9BACT|nr:acyltransferase [Hymenobacter defluvii]MBO3271735.1 acyltransferase [Hymenobacter defluvii]